MNIFEQLQNEVPAPGALVDIGWALDVFPAMRRLAQTPQDPHYHAEGDVWTHTVMVADQLVNSADYAASTPEERFILFFAALLHDIAKPDTTVIDEATGKIGQPGHSRRGAIDARMALWRAGVPFAVREAICRIIAVHQLPFFAIAGNKGGLPAEFLVRKLSHELDLRLLAAVAEADMRGRTYTGKAECLVDIELFREMARDEGCYGRPRTFADLDTQVAYFRGASISPDYPFHTEPGSHVTVMAGLPASGKNTWVAKHCPALPVISFDDAREALGIRHGANAGAAVHKAIDDAKGLLRDKADFVFNATHISNTMRKKTLDLLYAYNANVTIVYLEQPEAVLMSRNTRRDTTLTNATIRRMLFKWEVPLPTEAHRVRYAA